MEPPGLRAIRFVLHKILRVIFLFPNVWFSALSQVGKLENLQKDVKTLLGFDWLRSVENQQKDVTIVHAFDWLKSLGNREKGCHRLAHV